MVILHPRVGRWSEVDRRGRSRRQQHQRPCGGSTPLRMPTNGLLQAAELEPRCVAQSVRTLPTQPNPRWQKRINSNSQFAMSFINNND